MITRALDGTLLNELKRWSKKKIVCKCDMIDCNREWETNYFHVAEVSPHYCFNCNMSITKKGCIHSQAHRENLSKSVKSSEAHKKAMLAVDRKETAAKHSELMKQRWKEGTYKPLNEEQRKRISQAMRGNTNSSGQSGGFCKWYLINNNGLIEKVQGTWELLYANYLIEQGVAFKSHPNFIYYQDKNRNKRRYFPDFYLLEDNLYIDVKNPFCIEQDKEKIECIREAGINLVIVGKEQLIERGLL